MTLETFLRIHLLIAALYLIYRLLLHRSGFHALNRRYLLIMPVVAFAMVVLGDQLHQTGITTRKFW